MQSPSKASDVSLPGHSAFSGPQGWVDLPDGLLHSIVARLGSFRDLLGFAATCPSWRAAFSSHPSKSLLREKFPPLLIQPHVRVQGPLLPCTGGLCELYTCKVIDPANQKTALRCWIPEENPEKKMHFIGSSCGNFIYFCSASMCCLIIDVLTGVEVSTPRFPYSWQSHLSYFSAILTAPPASPNSHLLVGTASTLFDLRVGSDSWSQLQVPSVDNIVEFNGQFIATDGFNRIWALQLSPQLGVQEIRTNGRTGIGRLVVCGDMLLMLTYSATLYRLDMSTDPATWTIVSKLDNWALFVGGSLHWGANAPLSCMSPELWGGMSNIKYHACVSETETWALYGLCGWADPVRDKPSIDLGSSKLWELSMSPLWLYPSMF